AAFGGDAELRYMTPRRGNTRLRAGDAVLRMHDAEIELGAGRKLEIAERLIERVVGALDRHRHMNVGELVRDRAGQCIREADHLRRVLRLDEMLAGKIPVAEMQADLDVGGNARTQALHAREERLRRLARVRRGAGLLAVPHDHLVAEVPLDAE